MASAGSSAIHPDTIAEAFLPPPALRGGLICVLHRDTRGCELNPLQRFTYGTATTNMTITWYWRGNPQSLSVWAPDDLTAPRVPVPGPVRISGGTTRPWIGYSTEPSHMLIAIFRSDAMRRWFGLDPQQWIDRAATLDDIGDDVPWAPWARAIQAAGEADVALPILYEGLLATVPAEDSTTATPPSTAQWLDRVIADTQSGERATSRRTAQRNIKRSVGLSARKTRKLARLESLSVDVGERVLKGDPVSIRNLAEDAGYYDQAQLTRDMRDISGFTAAEAIRRAFSDESFWIIRAFYSVYMPDQATGR